MSSITYTFASIDQMADYFVALAERVEAQRVAAKTEKERGRLSAEAYGLRTAAMVVRDSRIDAEMSQQ